jgi:UDP-3-O-[3-hydroxymyristoyl] glucosamine N-acyltransferase
MEIAMSSETFFVANHNVFASEIAALAGIPFATEDFAISAAGALATAGVGELCFMDDIKYIEELKVTRASACLISPRFKELVIRWNFFVCNATSFRNFCASACAPLSRSDSSQVEFRDRNDIAEGEHPSISHCRM